MAVAIVLVLLVVGLYALTRFRLNQEYQRAAIFRVGRSAGVKGPGLFWLVPFVDRAVQVDIRVIALAFPAQEMVTSDGLTLKLNFVAWYKIVDAQRAIVEVKDWQFSVQQAAETAMRDVVGQKTLEAILRGRSDINTAVRDVLATVTSTWGVEVERIEIKDIDIPENMQRAMARVAEAAREKAARVIKAEGEFEAAEKLREAADLIAGSPGALELRRLQTIAEVGVEKNSVIVMALPMEAMGSTGALTAAAIQRVGNS